MAAALMAAVGTSACMPDHLARFDGKLTVASLKVSPNQEIVLTDDQGGDFRLMSPSVLVGFEVNRISKSKLYFKDDGRQATFLLPKALLNQPESRISSRGSC